MLPIFLLTTANRHNLITEYIWIKRNFTKLAQNGNITRVFLGLVGGKNYFSLKQLLFFFFLNDDSYGGGITYKKRSCMCINCADFIIPMVGCCCCSVTTSCSTLQPHGCSKPGFPVPPHLPGFVQTQVHWVHYTIQPSDPLLPPSSPALDLSQHYGTGLLNYVPLSLSIYKSVILISSCKNEKISKKH